MSSKTPGERISDLEAQMQGLKDGLRMTGGIFAGILQSSFDEMVEANVLTEASRRAIWRRLEKELLTPDGIAAEVMRGFKWAIPRFRDESWFTGTAPRSPQRDVLRVRKARDDGDQG